MDDDRWCRLCGARLRTGLIASGRRACCLNATPIVGTCPTHGPLGPHHATDSEPDSGGDLDPDTPHGDDVRSALDAPRD
ncbi:hypothetical protein [Salinigranum sp. GCM10025319]|uniref:hypothetical protein n=1 Tax=Salinigranum sp. GCM10025319 TaxID=3252687 RepID=UPI003614DC6D